MPPPRTVVVPAYPSAAMPGAVLVPAPAPVVVAVAPQKAPAIPRRRVFQLDQTLSVDHCTLSAVALSVSEDGQWILSLRADQNPPVAQPATLGGLTPQLDTAYLLRNQFHVEVRCYGSATAVLGPQADQGPGKPVLCQLCVPDFWVQRGQPKHVRQCNCSDDVRKSFNDIDRVEVDFYYYK